LKVNVKFSVRFREIFGADERQMELQNGANVGDLLDILCDSNARRIKLFGTGKNLRPNVLVTKNGRFIVHLNWLDTALSDGDKVEILSLVSGG
jgi:MoaD family protein